MRVGEAPEYQHVRFKQTARTPHFYLFFLTTALYLKKSAAERQFE